MADAAIHSFTSARAFLDYLSPTSHSWGGEPYRWCYRGHGDSAWQLLPRLFRPRQGSCSCGTRISLFKDEYTALVHFFQALDRKGLPIPFDGPELRAAFPPIGGEVKLTTDAWPPDIALPLLALAQHHGIPTRVLDWTHSAYTAAYFAAKEHVTERERGNEPDSLAVWAWCYRDHEVVPTTQYLKLAKIDGRRAVNGRFVDPDGWTISPVVVPGAENPNLHAQQGMFSVLRNQSLGLGVEVIPKSHDRIALEVQKGSQYPDHPPDYPVARYELDGAESVELLRLLSLMGVDASAIWPGIDGAAKAVIERSTWDNTGERS